MAIATLSRWGNSSAVRIPNHFIKKLRLEEGAEVEMTLTPDNAILIRPLIKPQEAEDQLRAHLKQLLSKIKPDQRHEEVDWGSEEGDERI